MLHFTMWGHNDSISKVLRVKKSFLLKLKNFCDRTNGPNVIGLLRYFMQWNFQVMPRLFNQLFIIHGLKVSQKPPLVWAFIDGKTTGHYRKVFLIVRNKIQQDTGNHCEPAQVISDYKRAKIRDERKTSKLELIVY